MNALKKFFYIITFQPCKAYGHAWKFAYNYGIPLGCKWSYEEIEEKRKCGEVFEVHKCSRCGNYDHESDGLGIPYAPYTE